MYTFFVIAFVNWEQSDFTESIDFLDAEHLTDLPPYIYSELLVLAKLAMNGIQEHKYIFDSVPQLHLRGFCKRLVTFTYLKRSHRTMDEALQQWHVIILVQLCHASS